MPKKVDKEDPAFQNPTKPIGSFYTKEEADKIAQEKGYVMKEDAGRGYRRVVPSPAPKRVVELSTIKYLLKKGNNIYIACTDIHNGGVSYVDIFDLEKKEVLNLLQCENEIMQMEITDSEDSIYILSLEELIQYKIEKGQAEEINRISVESEDTYFIGGFYLKEE